MQWPGSVVPPDYDPGTARRARSVVVVDVSNSMSRTRIGMAKAAAKAVETLTEADFTTFLSSSADAYSSTLVRATEANKASMENWININVVPGGNLLQRAVEGETDAQ